MTTSALLMDCPPSTIADFLKQEPQLPAECADLISTSGFPLLKLYLLETARHIECSLSDYILKKKVFADDPAGIPESIRRRDIHAAWHSA